MTQKLSAVQANRLIADTPYRITRGAYTGTHHDRADRWYIEDTRSCVVDRANAGYRTLREALDGVSFMTETE